LYGEVRTADDLLMAFAAARPHAKEKPSDFLLRLWDLMNKVKEIKTMTEADYYGRVYHHFCHQLPPLMALEVRQQFGFPGEACPDPTKLLVGVRRMELVEGTPTSAKAHAAAVQAQNQGELSKAALDRIAEKVAAKLRPGRGKCWKCGQPGHIARRCPENEQPLNQH
jgi:hypothetical protein